jgi:L-methionine (R)-S-oxide reductase
MKHNFARHKAMNEFLKQIESLLQQKQPLESVLREVLNQFHSETGTIHRLDAETQLLHLAAQAGLPPPMLDIVKTIPVGKGIAGQVIAQDKPVTICDLQTDTSGAASPGAKQTGVGGALCVPIRHDNKTVGTLGIGTLRQHQYTPEETRALEDIGRVIGVLLK